MYIWIRVKCVYLSHFINYNNVQTTEKSNKFLKIIVNVQHCVFNNHLNNVCLILWHPVNNMDLCNMGRDIRKHKRFHQNIMPKWKTNYPFFTGIFSILIC